MSVCALHVGYIFIYICVLPSKKSDFLSRSNEWTDSSHEQRSYLSISSLVKHNEVKYIAGKSREIMRSIVTISIHLLAEYHSQ